MTHDERRNDLVRIGVFSHLGRVSTRLLRHYDSLGLLSPFDVDPESGYRLYATGQLGDLHRILALRDLGLSLEQVKVLVDRNIPSEELREMLERAEDQAARELAETRNRLSNIRARLAAIEPSPSVGAEFEMVSLPARAIRSVRGDYTPAEARKIVSALYVAGSQADIEPPVVAAVWRGPYDDEQWSLELGVFSDQPVDDEPLALTDSELAGGRFITVKRAMPADAAHNLYAAVPAFCADNDLSLNGRLRELVMEMPPPVLNEAPLVEVQFGVD